MARSFRPAAIVLDIGLPVVDGYEVARQLRAIPELHAAQIIAVTGYGQTSDITRALAAGVDHHRVKPVEIDDLRGLLDGAV
jgi:CheY-like chemotaxis protein